jgi:hypothetical protein
MLLSIDFYAVKERDNKNEMEIINLTGMLAEGQELARVAILKGMRARRFNRSSWLRGISL